MTALPHTADGAVAPFTVADYAALGEDDDRAQARYELQEGSLVMSPSPSADHSAAVVELVGQIRGQLPPHLELLVEIDVDLDLAAADQPGFVRRPDLAVAQKSARQRVRDSGGLIRASEVVLVVEIVSPGSRRMDNVIKRGEYADAGIPYYWIIDLTEPASLVACHHTEAFGYQDGGATTGAFTASEPFATTLDLDRLG